MTIEIVELIQAVREDATAKVVGVSALLSHTVEEVECLISTCIARDFIRLILLEREVNVMPCRPEHGLDLIKILLSPHLLKTYHICWHLGSSFRDRLES